MHRGGVAGWCSAKFAICYLLLAIGRASGEPLTWETFLQYGGWMGL
jgi:hypothetical protein